MKQRCQQHPRDSEQFVQQKLMEYRQFAEELNDFYMDEGVFSITTWLSSPWASEEGQGPPGFWKFQQKQLVFVVSRRKTNFTTFTPPQKNLENSLSCSAWKNPSDGLDRAKMFVVFLTQMFDVFLRLKALQCFQGYKVRRKPFLAVHPRAALVMSIKAVLARGFFSGIWTSETILYSPRPLLRNKAL